jgi:hypothetical protein
MFDQRNGEIMWSCFRAYPDKVPYVDDNKIELKDVVGARKGTLQYELVITKKLPESKFLAIISRIDDPQKTVDASSHSQGIHSECEISWSQIIYRVRTLN